MGIENRKRWLKFLTETENLCNLIVLEIHLSTLREVVHLYFLLDIYMIKKKKCFNILAFCGMKEAENLYDLIMFEISLRIAMKKRLENVLLLLEKNLFHFVRIMIIYEKRARKPPCFVRKIVDNPLT